METTTKSIEVLWATPDIDEMIAYLARVSNPDAQKGDPFNKLISYLVLHKHWSPFEMANICVRIDTTRDIGRQMIRHRSLHFQEFSQRYAAVTQEEPVFTDARMQDTKNRQNSLPCEDALISDTWVYWQNKVWDICWTAYKACLHLGIAKEVARKLLPEGLTRTTMYVNGTVRDWFHYLAVRSDLSTQLEHRVLANALLNRFIELAPATFGRLKQDD